MSGLAAQFGVGIPSVTYDKSPAFYAELVRSKEILGKVIETTFQFEEKNESYHGNLIDLFEIQGDDNGERWELALEKLKKALTVSSSIETGIVRISVLTKWARLSEQITQRILQLISEFNMETRQSQALAERGFVEERLKEKEVELDDAENRLQRFLQENRQLASPEVEFEHDRLQRVVLMRQQVVTSLAQAYEQAQIDEVRDTPVITIIDRPRLPGKPDSRRLILKAILSVSLGLIVAVFAAFSGQFLGLGGGRDETELNILKKEALEDLRHPWRLLKRSPTKR